MDTDQRAHIHADPLRFGVGARVTVAIMAADYAEKILGALESVDTTGLTVETTDVSTYLGGSEEDLLRYLTDLGQAVAATGDHASIAITLSRGCPGEAVCDLPGGAGPRRVDAPAGTTTGDHVTADWALYPLADEPAPISEPSTEPGSLPGSGPGSDSSTSAPAPDHMRDIMAAIDTAKKSGLDVTHQHFSTRLAGDLGLVLSTVVGAWTAVGATVQHVTSHLTLSLNSPSHP